MTGTAPREEEVGFKSDGVALEGRLASSVGATRGVVLCHPHPLYGGSMGNNVVLALVRELTNHGVATLRFNFRGVGKSEGSYDEGEGETRDALAAFDFLAVQSGLAPEKLVLCGYSFGSMVALRAFTRQKRAAAVVAISPVWPPPEAKNDERPRFFIYGQRDDVIDQADLRQYLAECSGPLETTVHPHANHFWYYQEDDLATAVTSFITKAQLA